jgi:hypothetical protein
MLLRGRVDIIGLMARPRTKLHIILTSNNTCSWALDLDARRQGSRGDWVISCFRQSPRWKMAARREAWVDFTLVEHAV